MMFKLKEPLLCSQGKLVSFQPQTPMIKFPWRKTLPSLNLSFLVYKMRPLIP